MSKQLKITIIAAIVMIIVTGFYYLINDKAATETYVKRESITKAKPPETADHLHGNSKAPVQLMVYSDFQCPFCLKFLDTVKQIENYFGDKVAIIHRHFPLSSHPLAMTAALASECAAEQGKFWQMRDQLFADNKSNTFNVEQFRADAIGLGLDGDKFNQCFASGKYQDKILNQIKLGKASGVIGAPTVFVNDKIFPGAYPFDDFISPEGKREKGMKSVIEGLLK